MIRRPVVALWSRSKSKACSALSAATTENPAPRSTASRTLSCVGLSSITRTSGKRPPRPYLRCCKRQNVSGSVLLTTMARQHLLFGVEPVLIGPAVGVSALFVKLIGAQPDFRFQIGALSFSVAAVFRHGQYVVFGLRFRCAGSFCSSHYSLLKSSNGFEPHIDATTKWLLTSFVAVDVIIINRSGCGIVNPPDK